jgi:hypothetical protein
MKENNFTLTKDIEQYYMGKVLSIANKIGYKVTVWQDVHDNNVKVINRFNNIFFSKNNNKKKKLNRFKYVKLM